MSGDPKYFDWVAETSVAETSVGFQNIFKQGNCANPKLYSAVKLRICAVTLLEYVLATDVSATQSKYFGSPDIATSF